MAEDGVVAGRLEVPVESNTAGFGKRLQAAITKEVEGVVAKVGVEWEEKGLKGKLEALVDTAARGVQAKIDVVADTAKAKAEIEKLGANTKVKVAVENLTDDVKRQSLLARIFAKKNPIQYPVKADRPGLLSSLFTARNAAEKQLKRKPIELPFGNARRLRSTIMPLLVLAIGSVIQPAIAAIVGGLGGLLPMVGNLATSFKALAIGGPVISGLLGGFFAAKQAIDFLSDKASKNVKALAGIRKEFKAVTDVLTGNKKKVALAFFGELDGYIKPLAKTLIPTLNRGMVAFGRTTGRIGADLAKWANTPLFNDQLTRLLASGDVLLGGFGKALLGVSKAFMNVSDAATIVVGKGAGADSLLGRFNKGMERFASWASKIAAPGEKAKAFAEELGYAADKASQLGRILKGLTSGIAGVFRAGREEGDSLLATFEEVITKWDKWVRSADGQKEIKDWYAAVEPIVREIGSLLADVGKSILRLAKDPSVTSLLNKIRTEMLPALEGFLSNLGKTLGPEVIDFFTELIDVLASLSAAGGPLATGLGYVNDALGKVAKVLRDNPDIAAKLGTILGALLAYRVLAFVVNISGVLNMLTGLGTLLRGGSLAGLGGLALTIAVFAGALKDLPAPLQGAAAALGTFLLLRTNLPAMQAGLRGLGDALFAVKYHAVLAAGNYRTAMAGFKATGSSGIGAATRAVGTTARSGLRGALAALATGLGAGGLWGGAIIGATALVGVWATKHAEAAQKAIEYNSHVQEIVASLDQESGALTQASKQVVASKLIHEGADTAARKYGVSLSDLTDAAVGNADAGARVRKSLADNITKFIESDAAAGQFKATLKAAGVSMDTYSLSQVQGGETAKDMRAKVLSAAQASGIHGIELDRLRAKLEKNITGHQDLAAKVSGESQAVKDATARHATLNEMLGKSKVKVDDVTAAIAKVKSKTVTVTSLTADAETKLRNLGYKVERLPNGKVTITATSQTASAEASLRYAARTRYARIQAVYTGAGRSYGGGLTQADGGIVQFLNGGIHKAMKSVQSFANGTEKHIAQIARPGEWRLWAEPETGGEAYIPLAGSKRARSMAILREVADRFGMTLAPKFASLAQAMSGQHGSMRSIAAFAAGSAGSVGDLHSVRGGGVTFEYGAIQVNNPVAEPAGKSIASTMRGVGALGLFDGEG